MLVEEEPLQACLQRRAVVGVVRAARAPQAGMGEHAHLVSDR